MSTLPRLGRPANPKTEHRRVAALIRSWLASGRLKAGEVLPSFRALCAEWGVSYGAVRLAVKQLKGEGRLKANPLRRIVAAGEGSPAMDGRDAVLAVFSQPLHQIPIASYRGDLIGGLWRKAGALGVPLIFAHHFCFKDTLPSGFLERPLKGIVLAGTFSAACLEQYARLPLPVVVADQPPLEERLSYVSVENIEAARAATARLIAAGHRRIAFVRRVLVSYGNIDPDSKERQLGFTKAMREAGLSCAAGNVFNTLEDRRRPTQYVQRIFTTRPAFTAALCADPAVAEVVRAAAQAAAVRFPEQFGIVCFQDLRANQRDEIPYAGPAIDFVRLGERALELLQQGKAGPRCVRVPCVWQERGSFVKKGASLQSD